MQNGTWTCRLKLLHKVKFLILLIWILMCWKEDVHWRCQRLTHHLTHRKASSPSVSAFLSSPRAFSSSAPQRSRPCPCRSHCLFSQPRGTHFWCSALCPQQGCAQSHWARNVNMWSRNKTLPPYTFTQVPAPRPCARFASLKVSSSLGSSTIECAQCDITRN